ncbi:hypothetical protein METBIDRAFT_32353 [Metschnikowia bicuspidata var. bicuspidata NRRL YB-4993]|uniref:PH-like domain-containing protein n=1 Tax=Metschnikowia bicuspidata var. bicuspidata NRRL YB-4993 TaxID=869754 RepID=A0A1A0H8A6_9ASCO|nr:hypothetical protein METBIDRAFT_32353 [Metschnikowia bicuspidata var. bicuspidata NRRL YB-4993]OBA20344.1 hypothetical protein METBIDRAFT_32353 [Metschnikowia bicuspidata var. bicuspidata NRRL YB-4993]
MADIIQALHRSEALQLENLIALLGVVKGLKIAGPESQIPSLVRGLCTSNQKLLQMTGAAPPADAPDADHVKLVVNDFLVWFDGNFVVFEKLLQCLSAKHITQGTLYQQPVLHSQSYVDFARSMARVLRNPFILDKLAQVQARASAVIARTGDMVRQARLSDISFDHVQTFAGRSVSCFFTPAQIVRRSEDAPLFLGEWRVEMLLLKLGLQTQPRFDAWAVLNVPAPAARRSVVYPPFRVNELAVALAGDSLRFSSLSLDLAPSNHRFAISGPPALLDLWFRDLRAIFPTSDKLLHSSAVQLLGLGIHTVLVPSDDGSRLLPCSTPESEGLLPGARRSLDSGHSMEIMKKTLSSSGMEPELKERQLTVVQDPKPHYSIEAEYAYPEDADAQGSADDDSVDCFDVVTSVPQNHGLELQNHGLNMLKHAAASMPDVSAATAPSIYINAAGSAIDVDNFGKSHNPSFASLPAAEKKAQRKSFLDLFRKRRKEKAASSSPSEASEGPSLNTAAVAAEPPVSMPAAPHTAASSDASASANDMGLAKKPAPAPMKRPADLQIQIPKISDPGAASSQPGSATSASNRTLPLPFALPSSTSTYFFKPHLNAAAGANGSTTSLPGVIDEKPYEIPQDFKDIVNAADSLDFYITPVSPNSIKVSKWKPRHGKWEMLTSNENVFLKIVANYNIYKSWLLVFKEEYDEEYGEVIDKPLLVLDLDENTSARLSTALDIEIHATDAFSKQKTHIIVRCFTCNLVQAISTNFSNILEVMNSKKSLTQSSKFESMGTLSSSLASKPSTSSTLHSIFDQIQTPAASGGNTPEENSEGIYASGTKLLLDRITIKLHRQMELYEQIHRVSSWKALAMYSLSILHSVDASQMGFYHFDMHIKEEAGEEKVDEYLWTFQDDKIHEYVETIGKAATLVKASEGEIYMLECRGKKELKRLISLF